MGVLAEYVKKEAEHLKKEVRYQEEAAKEWQEAVNRLYRQLIEWVHSADGGNNLLRAERKPGDILQEPRLGVHAPDRLVISLGGCEGVIAPRARFVAAVIKPPGREARRADGTVEIKSASGVAEYYLFRLKDGDGDRWYIQSVVRWNSDREYGIVDELDQDRFEAAALVVLQ